MLQVNDLQRKLTAAEESLTVKQREVLSLRSERTAHAALLRKAGGERPWRN